MLWAIDHPDGGTPFGLGERARRDLDAVGRGEPEAADDRGAEPHGLGRIGEADLDLERSRRGIRLRRDLPHPADRLHARVVAQRDLDRGVAGARLDELLGNVEDGVASALARDLHDHLPGMNDLAGLGADRGDRAGRVGDQLV